MSRPKVIIFDVNETLLDLSPLKASVGKALGGRDEFLSLWFSTMLHYSLVETLSDNYHSFEEIGTAALVMVAKTQGIDLEYDDAKEAIVGPMRSLPAHPDVVAALNSLRASGYRIVSLTNSSSAGVETQFENAELTDLFEKRYSVDSVKKFKPHPDTYRYVLNDLGVQPEEVLMVAAHAWDLAGAKNVGLQTAFVARPGKTLYPNVATPDYVVKDLSELAKHFKQLTENFYFFRKAGYRTAEELARRSPDPIFDEATGVLQMIARNPEERQLYHDRLKAERDEWARTEQAKREGELVGKIELLSQLLAHDRTIAPEGGLMSREALFAKSQASTWPTRT